jgi:hypothetical protein
MYSNNQQQNGGRGRGRGRGKGKGRGRGVQNNNDQTPVTLNDVNDFIKYNKSDIVCELNIVSKFEQGMDIPKKVVNEQTFYPEKDMEAHIYKKNKNNIMTYEYNDIISIPKFLSSAIDLNLYYSYGLLDDYSIPYSILYQIYDEFKFMNETDKNKYYNTWKNDILDKIINVTKGVATKRNQKYLCDNLWNHELIEVVCKICSCHIVILNLNEKKIEFMYNKEENDNDRYVIIFYCDHHNFPLIHMYGVKHGTELYDKCKTIF